MKIAVEDISSIRKKIRVDIPAEEVDGGIKFAYKKLQSTVSIAGFRKGKVPLEILRERHSKEVEEEVSTQLIQSSFPRVLREKGLSPVSAPMIEIERFERGKPFIYHATLEIHPEIDPQGYKEIRLKKREAPPDITDTDVDEVLEQLREQHAEYSDVDRGVEDSDLIVIDFKGTVDGKEIEGGSAEDYLVPMGENAMLPGMEEALKGVKTGESREVTVTLPYDFKDKAIAGEDVLFDIKVKSVKEKVLHELDDEFAVDLGCDNLDALKEKIRGEVHENRQRVYKEELRADISEKLLEGNETEVPSSLVKKYLKQTLDRVKDNMKKGVVAPEDNGLSEDKLRERYESMVISQLKRDMIFDSIAEKESIEVLDSDLDEKINRISDRSGETPDMVRKNLEERDMMDMIRKSLLDDKVVDFIISNAIFE